MRASKRKKIKRTLYYIDKKGRIWHYYQGRIHRPKMVQVDFDYDVGVEAYFVKDKNCIIQTYPTLKLISGAIVFNKKVR